MSRVVDGGSARRLGPAVTNLLLAATFGSFAYVHLRSLLLHPRLSILLIIVVETLVALMLLTRRDPDKTWHSWNTWITTSAGTFLPLLLRPTDASADLLAGQLIQAAGFLLQIAALLSLNRSFGLLPAHRGVKSTGLYGWVRHPLYSSYLITHTGYLINNLSGYNAVVIVIATLFQVLRIRYEEQLLMQYPDYARYAQQTRWRLIPVLW